MALALVRAEEPADVGPVRDLISTAFSDAPRSSGTEAEVVDTLRRDGALAVSLVATLGREVVGHIAFSPVTIDGAGRGCYGLGPLAVSKRQRGRGFGTRLVESGLDRLRTLSATGCVVLGDPDYYGRFGFRRTGDLRLPGAPTEFFLELRFDDRPYAGVVAYHPAFGAS